MLIAFDEHTDFEGGQNVVELKSQKGGERAKEVMEVVWRPTIDQPSLQLSDSQDFAE